MGSPLPATSDLEKIGYVPILKGGLSPWLSALCAVGLLEETGTLFLSDKIRV